MANSTYDPNVDDRGVPHHGADVEGYNPQTTPLGDSSDPRQTGALGMDDINDQEQRAAALGEGTDSGDAGSSAISPDRLNAAEAAPSGQFTSGGAASLGAAGGKGLRGKVINKVTRNKKWLGIGGGGIAGLVATALVTFMLMIPLKIEHVVQNLENHFFASSAQAVDDTTSVLMSSYIVNHVLPTYKNCSVKNTVNSSCRVRINAPGNNPVRNLYRSWAQARLENQLATKYHIEFSYDKAKSVWRIKAPGTADAGDSIGPNGEGLEKEFHDRPAVRAAYRQSLKDATHWYQVWFRYKVGGLMDSKYHLRRCLIFCGVTDPLNDKIESKKLAGKIYLAERVLGPRSELQIIAIRCFFDDTCDPTKTQDANPSDTSIDEDGGTPMSDVETEGQSRLDEIAASYGTKTSDELLSQYKELSAKGFRQYMIKQVLSKVMGESAADAAAGKISDAIPIIGWVNFAAQVVNTLNDAGPKLKKLGYITNAPAAVNMYQMLRSYADEIHTGHVDATEVGAMTSLLGEGTPDKNDPLVGGTASAEQAPLYSAIMDTPNSSSTSTSLLDDLLPSKAYAATSGVTSPTYVCDNGKSLPAGQLMCSEDLLGVGNGVTNSIHDFMNLPGMDVITTVAKVWKASLGHIFNVVNGAISLVASPAISAVSKGLNAGCSVPGLPTGLQPANLALPGYCSIQSLMSDVEPKVLEAVSNWLIPNGYGSNMGGGKVLVKAAEGAEVENKDECDDQMGCKKVPTSTVTAIINQRESAEKQAFQSESMFARMFDTSSSYSLVSRVAMAIPFDVQASAASSTASFISNPFATLLHGFGSIFSSPSSFADPATDSATDPAGIGSSALPTSDIPSNPETYWDQHCSDNASHAYQNDADYNNPATSYNKNVSINENTGMPEHNISNPCLAIKNTVGDDGGVFDKGLLTNTEQNIGNNNQASTDDTSSSGSGNLPSGTSQELANQLLPYISQGKIFCGTQAGGSGSADCSDIQNTAKGQPLGGYCQVKELTPHLLGLILALVKDDGWSLGISAICSDHHAEGDGAYAGHSYGSTADFSVQISKDGKRSSGAAAASNQDFVNDVAALLSSTGGSFGQVALDGNVDGTTKCHAAYPSEKNSKFTLFADTCNHQHVRAAP